MNDSGKKQFEPYEENGKWWYYAISFENDKQRVTFGPFLTKNAADIDSTQAEACWG